MRSRARLLVGSVLLAGGVIAWNMWPADTAAGVARALDPVADARSIALAEARRSWRGEDLDAFVAAQRSRAEAAGAVAADWRVLAEAHLERALARGQRGGMAIGVPLYTDVPVEVQRDLDLGDAALGRARELGDATSESYRIEAALQTSRITGFASALRLDAAVRRTIENALRIDGGNPRAQVASACRALFTPSWLGGDPVRARRELEAAAAALPLDERPLVFAAMAAHVAGDATGALELCRAAQVRNSANAYARTVVDRLERGEAKAFERDVD